ncbi:ArsR family transcriptional regulator [Bradymonas sediminis]|nr:ArsR family transcriptional regulator [Bradymonas sediminis]
MSLNELPSQLYTQFASIGQALSNDSRLRLLNLLAQSERSVDDLAGKLGQSVANTSAHLRVLKRAHMVSTRRDGRRVFYRLSGQPALKLWLALRDMGLESVPEVREAMRVHASDPDVIPDFEGAQLLDKVERGEVILLDLRPAEEYLAGHLPRAQSVPSAELSKRIDTLPRDREVVAYCRGPYCVAAIESVAKMRAQGISARRLAPGIAEWLAAGKTLETQSNL